MRNLLAFFGLLCSALNVCGQWTANTYELMPIDTLYDISRENNLTAEESSFPEYEFYQKPANRVYNLISLQTPSLSNNLWMATLNLKKDVLKEQGKSVYFIADLCTKNIKSITVVLADKDFDMVYSKKFPISYDGYQERINTNISEWEKDIPPIDRLNSKHDSLSIGENNLFVFIEPVNKQFKSELLVSEFALIKSLMKGKALSQTFYIPRHHHSNELAISSVKFMSPYIENSTTQENSKVMGSSIYLSAIPSEEDKKMLLYKMVLETLRRYPFYAERSLNRKDILQSFDQIRPSLADTISFIDWANKVDNFLVTNLKDGHLGVNVPRDNAPIKKVKPVRLYRFNRKLFVAAVFDEQLKKVLPVGAEVKSIDNIAIRYLLDSVDRVNKDAKSIGEFTEFVAKTKEDSTLLTYVMPNSKIITNTTIRYDMPLNVGKNFIAKQCYFAHLDTNTVYFQIKNWHLDVYRRFLNHWNEFKSARKIIFDLRGNGGGNSLSVIRLLSMFLDKPSDIYAFRDVEGNLSDSLKIKPNPYFRIGAETKVIILADNNTACASEIFMAGLMTNRPNTTFLGSESTAGVVASRYDIYFQDGVNFYTSALIGKPCLKGFGCIENKGIPPDIKIELKNVMDLKPYDDKILKYALAL